jgi:probable rRNA maturation factor
MPVIVKFNLKGKKPKVSPQTIKKYSQKMLSFLGLEDKELSLLFVTDNMIQKLNLEWRNKAEVTDVLSFPICVSPKEVREGYLLGDIVISYDTVLRRASKKKIPLREEIVPLIAHSLLHLIGYNHKDSKDKIEMQKKEKELIFEVMKKSLSLEN